MEQLTETIGSGSSNMDRFIRKKITANRLDDAFYTLDISSVEKLWKAWKSSLPRVKPFYAVKCNPNPRLLSLLAKLGVGFDVASKSELCSVLKLGTTPEDIIFANPCKMPSHISFAASKGVHYTTFDSKGELYKLKKHNPDTRALLRIRVDDYGAKVPLGAKYGAQANECVGLLKLAKKLNVSVVGVSFHVGSGAMNADTFSNAIQDARKVFDSAVSVGLPGLTVLDIGGGFVSDGGVGVGFSLAASQVNKALDEHFPPEMCTRVIAEPGRFFAEEPFTLACKVFGCRFRTDDYGSMTADYWINDGIYGSMSSVILEGTTFSARVLLMQDDWSSESYQSVVFGPTCDSVDTVLRNVWLPRLECGDWLVFPRMGAYTTCVSSSFNGFSIADIATYCVRSI